MVNRLHRAAGSGPAPRPAASPAPASVVEPGPADLYDAAGPVRALPGGLDGKLIVNSNHPEIIRGPGIALSTLPWAGTSHQDVPLEGAFEVFTHHQNRSAASLHQAVALHNPGSRPVTVTIGAGAAYVTREAPYRDTPEDVLEDPAGRLVSGPGDRVATGVLRGERAIAATAVTLAPGETRLVHAKEIPAGNELTSQFTFDAGGPVHAAVVIEDAPPTDGAVVARLRDGRRLAPNPDDKPPTPPGQTGPKIYGRVAGVQRGARWIADLGEGSPIVLPAGLALTRSWVLNAKEKHTVGTDQVQTATVISRYADAAYAAHGNYGVEYDVTVPLRNPSAEPREVQLHFDTPPTPKPPVPPTPPWVALAFQLLPFVRGFGAPREVSRAFRGTVAVETPMPEGLTETRWLHVSQKLGQDGTRPLHTVTLPPGAGATVRVRFRYPANATAPHVLRLVAPA